MNIGHWESQSLKRRQWIKIARGAGSHQLKNSRVDKFLFTSYPMNLLVATVNISMLFI